MDESFWGTVLVFAGEDIQGMTVLFNVQEYNKKKSSLRPEPEIDSWRGRNDSRNQWTTFITSASGL